MPQPLAAITPGIAGSNFLVGDEETVRWREFLLPIANRLGFTEAAFANLQPIEIAYETEDRLTAFTMSPFYGRVGGMVPDRAKRIVKALASAWPEQAASLSPWTLRSAPSPRITGEMSQLQQCAWKLPIAKAERVLGYHPPVPFAEGLSRSLAWLEFAGFPVKPLAIES